MLKIILLNVYILSKTGLYSVLSQYLCLLYNLFQVYPAVSLMYFISAAVILLASLALMVQFSVPYNRAERPSVLYSCIPVFFTIFCRSNKLLTMPVISKWL